MEETETERAWRKRSEEMHHALGVLARYGQVIEVRWCGLCEDHPGHTWEIPEMGLLCCLGGADGKKVKR